MTFRVPLRFLDFISYNYKCVCPRDFKFQISDRAAIVQEQLLFTLIHFEPFTVHIKNTVQWDKNKTLKKKDNPYPNGKIVKNLEKNRM